MTELPTLAPSGPEVVVSVLALANLALLLVVVVLALRGRLDRLGGLDWLLVLAVPVLGPLLALRQRRTTA